MTELEILTKIHGFKLRELETTRRIHERTIKLSNEDPRCMSTDEVDQHYLELFDAEIEALKAELDVVRESSNHLIASSETARPRTTDELRTSVLSGIDWGLTAPILSRFISQDAKDILHAQYTYWSSAADIELGRLLANLQSEGKEVKT